MNRRYRITRTTDFQRVRRAGSSYAHPLAVLVALRNGLAHSRFGITASRAVGPAVRRNRTKRRLREALRSYVPQVLPGWDIILIARPEALDADWADLRHTIGVLLRRAGAIERNERHEH